MIRRSAVSVESEDNESRASFGRNRESDITLKEAIMSWTDSPGLNRELSGKAVVDNPRKLGGGGHWEKVGAVGGNEPGKQRTEKRERMKNVWTINWRERERER